MKTPMQELINDVGNMAQGLDADELYDYFMKRSKELLEKEKQVIINSYFNASPMAISDEESKQRAEDYYNNIFTI